MIFWAEVEPVTEQRFFPSRDSGPVIAVSSARTSRSWPATKYGPAKATRSLRASVMEYVAKIMSTSPFSRAFSRFADGVWTHSMSCSATPSLSAT